MKIAKQWPKHTTGGSHVSQVVSKHGYTPFIDGTTTDLIQGIYHIEGLYKGYVEEYPQKVWKWYSTPILGSWNSPEKTYRIYIKHQLTKNGLILTSCPPSSCHTRHGHGRNGRSTSSQLLGGITGYTGDGGVVEDEPRSNDRMIVPAESP